MKQYFSNNGNWKWDLTGIVFGLIVGGLMLLIELTRTY